MNNPVLLNEINCDEVLSLLKSNEDELLFTSPFTFKCFRDLTTVVILASLVLEEIEKANKGEQNNGN